MIRPRPRSAVALFLILTLFRASACWADAPKPAEQPAEEKWLRDRTLTLTPAPVPVPALKYRLFPLASQLKEGNAVPIYLRLVHEQTDAAKREWYETPLKWLDMPFDQLPLQEAKKFLQSHRRMLQQLELGARRKHAEWNYTFDQESVIEILLPDAPSMRSYTPMLLLQARVQLAEGDYAAAAHTLQTGFAFARHISEGDFLINGLVAIALASQFEGTVVDFVQRPGAPNLYWGLSALPRPLISLRREMEVEQSLLWWEFPDLTDLEQERTAEQWEAVLKKNRTRLRKLYSMALGEGAPSTGPNTGPNDPAAKSPDLPAARKYLTETLKLPAAKVGQMSPAELLVRFIAGQFRVSYDDTFKWTYLPYPEARPHLAEVHQHLGAGPRTEATAFARGLVPIVTKVEMAQNRLERLIACLRVVEAVRMHAAANGGKLPEKLSDVKVVPLPRDPGTWHPFEYRKEGETATLSSRIPGEPLALTGIRYRLTLRK